MRSLTTLDDWSAADVLAVFALADAYSEGRGPAAEGAAVMAFCLDLG
jgi:ornithine carbamoyltransferase